MEFLKNFDIFSQPIEFNSYNQKIRKRTFFGAFLTISIIITTLIYFIYLLNLFFTNQIDPKFRMQTFVSKDAIDIPLDNEFVGFQFSYNKMNGLYQSLSEIEAHQNKTYIVFIPILFQSNATSYNVTRLNMTKCQNQLLDGYDCIDFDSYKNLSLTMDNKLNLKSYLVITAYRCQDTDSIKTFVPNNCANASQIDKAVIYGQQNIRLKTTQFNTTSNNIETNFKNQFMQNFNGQIGIGSIQTTKQITNVKSGFLIQNQETFYGPISHTFSQQTLDKASYIQQTGNKLIYEIYISVDENIQLFSIQYPTFPDILALCNSTFSFMMILGFFARKITQNMILQEMFILILQNIYQETYSKILKINKFVNFSLDLQLKQMQVDKKVEEPVSKEEEDQEDDDEEEEDDKISEKSIPKMVPFAQPKLGLTRFIINADSVNQEQQSFQDQNSIYSCIEQKAELIRQDCGGRIQSAKGLCIKRNNSITNKNTNQSIEQKNKFKINLINQNSTKIDSPSSLNFIQQQKSSIQQDKQQRVYQCNQIETDSLENQSFKQILIKKIKTLSEKPISQKVQNLLFKTRLCKKRMFLESQGLNRQMIIDIEEQVNDSLDYFKIYKDILMLKKAIFILLTKEQLAALQLVGFSDNQARSLTDLNSKIDIFSAQIGQRDKNYFEEQFNIHKSSEVQAQYIQQFLLRCQKQQNTIPIAYFFYYGTNTTVIQLNITKCSNSNLVGYNCIDFSSISNYTLMQSGKKDIQSKLYLLIYSCSTIDDFKKTVPDNCASQDEIDQFVNSEQAGLNLKLYTSQYNTTSQQNQINYLNKLIYPFQDQFVLSTIYAQQQVTQISQGLFIQSQSQYSSPINYNLQSNIVGQQQNDPYIEVELQMDQIVQQISIQFSTIPEILAQVNSIFALLLTFGFIFRIFSQKEILKDFFFVFLQNMYQDTYQKLLKANKLIEEKPQSQSIQPNTQLTNEQETQEKERFNNIFLPLFQSKFRNYIEQSQQSKQNNSVCTIEKDQIQNTENSKNNDLLFTDSEQPNQQSNTIINKQINIKQMCSLGQKIKNQSSQIQISKFKNSQQEIGNDRERILSDLNKNVTNSNLSIKLSSDSNYEYLIQKLRNIQDAKIFEKAKKFIFLKTSQFKLLKTANLWKNKKKDKDETCEFQSHKNIIEQQINKQLSILDLYKDFLFIKKSIMMLLSKEQLAAMHLVGYSSEYQTDQIKFQTQSNQSFKSYFEEQQDILNSQDLQCKYIQQFFQKFQYKIDNESDIDKRIISTIRKQ
ncbi:transmembrane protein, putative (macronuclear) [Tetrahymena thermophila SB210]|uniref:Transmembrane protein, putative n=1 Tax=Tetrahymena thermophila (strain SB210) TaxID=312017 RepID=Q23GB6_TETTS|nr:transmembrane protein, putative [Tetrahymena thermophila SB210]EAR95344.2 transmembrane protein, putative [Tetrahymena thermophila SB210]|eukprot:XP_001015589.2 transmembrane protein, putative [Tetrahymena thermophila SB210]